MALGRVVVPTALQGLLAVSTLLSAPQTLSLAPSRPVEQVCYSFTEIETRALHSPSQEVTDRAFESASVWCHPQDVAYVTVSQVYSMP